jgi:hypothetical protein
MRNHLRPALAVLAALATISIPAVLAAQEHPSEEKIQRSFAANLGATLLVDNYKGTIHINGSDTNQVAVNAVKRFSGSESERKWWMENTKVEFEDSGNRIEVRVRYPTQSSSCWLCWEDRNNYVAQVDLEIQVPRRINVDLNGYKPDIRISSVQGSIKIKSYKAPMTIESTNGSISIDTYKDTIRLKNVAVHGGLEVKSYKADTEIDARALDGASRLETYKGSVVLRVPGDIGLDVDFSGSRRGSFHTTFPFAMQADGRYTSNFRGTINKGGTPLTLRMGRGSISLEKLVGDL